MPGKSKVVLKDFEKEEKVGQGRAREI